VHAIESLARKSGRNDRVVGVISPNLLAHGGFDQRRSELSQSIRAEVGRQATNTWLSLALAAPQM
jgi:hypothetical protein